MRLSEFIIEHLEDILQEWESFAQSLLPATEGMTVLALRDHAAQILQAIAAEIETTQTPEEQFRKSVGLNTEAAWNDSAAALHGTVRHESNFSMLQVTAEYRALRATVLRLWLPNVTNPQETLDELVRFNEAIDQALAESVDAFAGRTSKARDMFLAILGHDLRAPLSTMTLAGQALRSPGLGPERVDELGSRVSKCASLMTSMVGDLADYTRAQLGKGLHLSRQHVDLSTTCAWAVEDATSTYPQTQFRLSASGDLRGYFDNTRMHRVLTNLLLNAAQHGTPNQPVLIHATGEPGELFVGVTNQGPVISEEARRSIFEPLVQLRADEQGVKLPTNMGLGLFIACEIARAHGGGIEVQSSETKGTTFTVRLPRQQE